MRLSYLLVISTAILLTGTSSAISAAENDIATSILGTAENQQRYHRSLRTGTLPQEKEERTVDLKKVTDIVDDTGYKFVDKLKRSETFSGRSVKDEGITAADKLTRSKTFSGLAVNDRVQKVYDLNFAKAYFHDLATVKKLKPEQLKESLGIDKKMMKVKLNQMSEADVKLDPGYGFWMHYKKYWDNLYGKTT
ncbi:hypothetical protein PHMEG_00010237 [Phytophthora megakarya]|uniref:RxLR effector protein n=1 Tax=Phytophthora megakarya TaxID=4795 RepID=A0A225WE78_9STRA|nr:hypothetical protein PHMEG_00010237 [Phytophthora megakarya]